MLKDNIKKPDQMQDLLKLEVTENQVQLKPNMLGERMEEES